MASSSLSNVLALLFFTIILTATTALQFTTLFPRATNNNNYESSLNQAKSSKPKLPHFKTRYFPQTLDHFSFQPKGYKIFYQKYLVNDRYWYPGKPIFVYTGNEGDIEWFANNTGFLLDIAPKFRALLVFIEHRYYGESLPFGKSSHDTPEKVGYLSSQQALADFAVLIRSLKHNLSSEASPVVVFGGSYGGMLATWFRLKYPHIAIGALASSAPILHFDDIVPKSSFYDAVSQDYKDASLNCFEVIKGSWSELDAFITHEGLKKLSQKFKSCKTLQYADSVENWLTSAFIYTAMVNYPTAANFMKPLPAYPVQQMCKIIDESCPGATKLSRAFAAASLYYNYSQTEKCFDIEHKSDAHGLDGWNYQACTEMIMPMSMSEESMFRPNTYDYQGYSDYCNERYGVRPRPHWITTEFGGQNIEKVLKRFGSNIIFSNGLQDPWSRGGVLKNISSSIIALVTKKGAHHADFRSATKDDPKWLKEQRRQEIKIIKKWLNEYYADTKDEC